MTLLADTPAGMVWSRSSIYPANPRSDRSLRRPWFIVKRVRAPLLIPSCRLSLGKLRRPIGLSTDRARRSCPPLGYQIPNPLKHVGQDQDLPPPWSPSRSGVHLQGARSSGGGDFPLSRGLWQTTDSIGLRGLLRWSPVVSTVHSYLATEAELVTCPFCPVG